MQRKSFRIGAATVDYRFEGTFSQLKELTEPKSTILVTDEHIFNAHPKKFRNWRTIVLKAGEQYKVMDTVHSVLDQMIGFEADRKSTLVGVGGGVVTDLTGFAA